MTDETPAPAPAPAPATLPDAPDLAWLRKQAKRRLESLRRTDPDAKLAQAQLALAREYGFRSWRALKAHVDARTVDGRIAAAARAGDADALAALLDAHPDRLHARVGQYGMTLLHVAAHGGHLAAVDLLLRRGLDPNARERGDDTYPMHWAAAAGHLDVVRRLADAGGDVVGHGDDHQLEVIGWATCWHGCGDAAHRAVADFLVARGARHHVFSAVALEREDELRRIVAADPSQLERPMSRNEGHQRPLHFAVRMDRPRMVALLLALGADPLGVDGDGYPPAAYATTPASALALAAWDPVSDAVREDGARAAGALHLLAKRGDVAGVRALLARGADPDARWSHWGAEVTPMHLAALHGHAEVVRALLDAGADSTIHDSMHDSDPAGWAEHAGQPAIAAVLRAAQPEGEQRQG